MENRVKEQRIFSILMGATFFIWWIGVGGSQLYLAPAFLLLLYSITLIARGEFVPTVLKWKNVVLDWITAKENRKWVLGFFAFHVIVWIGVVIFKYYSFGYSLYDVGWYSNQLFNISQGEFFSSVTNSHNFADHFTPSLSVIALLYKIVPSVHWMMLLKAAAFLFSPYFIFKIGEEIFPDKREAKIVGIVVSLLWLFLYRPIVNSMRFEFSPSALAPALIFFAFLAMEKGQWLRFFIVMVFLLGLKDHMGAIWIGLGLYLILQKPQKKTGFFLVVVGIAALYLILFWINPYFRDYAHSVNDLNRVNAFVDLPGKTVYFFNLLVPFLFIPFLFWKNGIMAGPAIGINLISGYGKMYSSFYHYDDLSSTLLVIAFLVSLKEFRFGAVFHRTIEKRWAQWGLVAWGVLFVTLMPYSNVRFFRNALPEKADWETVTEISQLERMTAGKMLAVQDVLGPHFYRREMQGFQQGKNCAEGNAFPKEETIVDLPPYDFVVLAPHLNNYRIRDMQQCIQDLDQSPKFEKVSGFQQLVIYEKKQLL